MQKIDKKIMANLVGENCVFPNSKGITLIALIITIIVMIILVGVTVNVALNGGLFGTSKKAAYQTEVSTIQEQLEAEKATKIAENNGKIPSNFGITINDLPISNELKSKYENKLKISKDGILYYDSSLITDEEEQSWLEEIGIYEYLEEAEDIDLSTLERYFLGEDKSGKNLIDLINTSQFNISFIDDTTTEADESKIEYLNLDAGGMNIRYNNKIYNIAIDETYKVQQVKVIYMTSGREGSIYKYDSNADGLEEDWIILYDYGKGKGIEIISQQSMGSLTLGYKDNTIEWKDPSVIADLEEIGGTETLPDIKKAIYSYNNAIKTINDYCKEQIKNIETPKENIRSVGSDPQNPYSENSIAYTSDRIENWNPIYNGVGKSSDDNYKQDVVRMICLGLENIDKEYWLASRIVKEDGTYVNFNVRAVDPGGTINNSYSIWNLWGQGNYAFIGSTNGFGVRPIIKIPNI